MDKLQRTIKSAHDLAHANGIELPSHVDQIIGAMTRKLADGLPDQAIYDVGRTVAKKLAKNEHGQRRIEQLLADIKLHGNPLISALQAL